MTRRKLFIPTRFVRGGTLSKKMPTFYLGMYLHTHIHTYTQIKRSKIFEYLSVSGNMKTVEDRKWYKFRAFCLNESEIILLPLLPLLVLLFATRHLRSSIVLLSSCTDKHILAIISPTMFLESKYFEGFRKITQTIILIETKLKVSLIHSILTGWKKMDCKKYLIFITEYSNLKAANLIITRPG